MNKWTIVTDLRTLKKGDRRIRVTYPDGKVREATLLFGAIASTGTFAGAFCWGVSYASSPYRSRTFGARRLEDGTVVAEEGYKVDYITPGIKAAAPEFGMTL